MALDEREAASRIRGMIVAKLPKRRVGNVIIDGVAEEITPEMDRACFACRARGARFFSVKINGESYPLVVCESCGAVYWNTFPDRADMDNWPENHRLGTL